ncbi:hypothetical protein ACHAWO_006113 [Cyclotella atomus]|jgi:hypothetical protein|uniref:Uncharacterized protein n=1 Tax=Cyclotella atomus TaxID=382360 RepID=A0ABD3MQ04_9STRA
MNMRVKAYILALGSTLFNIAQVDGFFTPRNHCKSSRKICQVSERCQDDAVTTLEWSNMSTRRDVLASMSLSTLVPHLCYADDLSNIVKSQADAEDPIAVFGKSLQNMGFESNGMDNSSSKSSPSFNDISFPSSAPNSDNDNSTGGDDLNRAIQQMKMEQKRRVDPMTHG